MAGELKALHGTTTAYDCTDLRLGIANGSAWLSNKITNTSPSDTDIVLSGRIGCDNSCLAGDVVNIYLVPLDAGTGDLGELSAGNLVPSTGDSEVATAANKLKMATLVASLPVSASLDVLYFVTPPIPCAYQSHAVAAYLISAAGTIGAEGDEVRYQFTSIQAQS